MFCVRVCVCMCVCVYVCAVVTQIMDKTYVFFKNKLSRTRHMLHIAVLLTDSGPVI